MPGYAEAAFGTRDEFFRLADRYLTDASLRGTLASGMRTAVVEGYSNTALVRDMLTFLRTRLQQAAD